MKKLIYFLLSSFLLAGCSSPKRSIQKNTFRTLSSALYDNQFTGLLVVNAQNKDTLLRFNSEKYFIPASNTKIFTLYTALKLLSDSIPALTYVEHNDTLSFEGTGDPTFLHTYFGQNKTLDFLANYENVALSLDNFADEKFGPGWAWDDYGSYYQPEIGAFPMYGNILTVHHHDTLHVTPSYFKDSVLPFSYPKNRDLQKNRFYFSPAKKDTLEIPFRTSAILTKELLSKALKREVALVSKLLEGEKNTLFSVPSDTVLRRMMHESDNFLAEQLLILSSSTLSDTLSGAKVRSQILENQLASLKQPPRWVDGSGLSRYNLFTPESLVAVLSKMYGEIPKERLFRFFPSGGTGTLEDWFAGDPDPYIYAKSGSLGNVYCLSGYLLTKSGKTLIFSFMNNHFRAPSSDVKKRMEGILEQLRDRY